MTDNNNEKHKIVIVDGGTTLLTLSNLFRRSAYAKIKMH